MTLTDIISKITLFAKNAIIGNSTISTFGKVQIKDTSSAYVTLDNDANGAILLLGSDGNGGILGTVSNHNCQLRTNNSTRVTITNSGNVEVGSGSTLGLGKLQIRDAAAAYMSLNNDSNGCVNFIGSDGNGGIIGTFTNHNFFVKTNNSNRITVLSGGNVGIGTIAPARPLHVTGIVRLSGLQTYANNAAAIAGGLAVDDVYKTTTGELRIVV